MWKYGGSHVGAMLLKCSNKGRCLVVIIMAVSFFCVSSNAIAGIVIKKKVDIDLGKYDEAYVDVQNDAYKTVKERRRGSDVAFINAEIFSALEESGILYSADRTSKLRVECHFMHGWGMPRLIRHFRIKARYITTVNIKLIDAPTNQIIGEVEYKRPWSKTSPKNLIKMMFDELLGKKEG